MAQPYMHVRIQFAREIYVPRWMGWSSPSVRRPAYLTVFAFFSIGNRGFCLETIFSLPCSVSDDICKYKYFTDKRGILTTHHLHSFCIDCWVALTDCAALRIASLHSHAGWLAGLAGWLAGWLVVSLSARCSRITAYKFIHKIRGMHPIRIACYS